ncbi:hypothetical protein BD410DRAFT_790549, partial [Rickenella mellea]
MTAEWTSFYLEVFFINCALSSAAGETFTIAFYDYALTLPTEISLVWKAESRFNGAQALFFATRYSFLISIANQLAQRLSSNHSDTVG